MINPQLEKGRLIFTHRTKRVLAMRYLETTDLHELPLDMFGANAGDDLLTKK